MHPMLLSLFGPDTHARGGHEAKGEVVVRLHLKGYNFLMVEN